MKNHKGFTMVELLAVITILAIIMVIFSITATSFSSIYYILICGGVGVIVYFFKKNIQR